jgi:NitT/TauT family transport system permease protein
VTTTERRGASVRSTKDGARGPGRRRGKVRWWVGAGRLGLLAVLVAAWQVVASNGIIDPFFISMPSSIANRLGSWFADGSIWTNLGPTMAEAAIGFAISAVVGTGLGLLLARFEALEVITRPFVDIFNTLPRIALAPLFVLWFGFDMSAKVYLVVSVVSIAFLINTYAGVTSVDSDFVRLAQNLGGGRAQVISKIIIPSITPWLFAAVRFGVAYSLATAIVGEIVAANEGLGFLISYASGVLDTTGVFAALVTVAIVAWIVNTAIAYLERYLLRWQTAARRGSTVY